MKREGRGARGSPQPAASRGDRGGEGGGRKKRRRGGASAPQRGTASPQRRRQGTKPRVRDAEGRRRRRLPLPGSPLPVHPSLFFPRPGGCEGELEGWGKGGGGGETGTLFPGGSIARQCRIARRDLRRLRGSVRAPAGGAAGRAGGRSLKLRLKHSRSDRKRCVFVNSL